MSKKIMLLLMLVLMLVPTAFAQEQPPEQINLALQDLSTQVGVEVTLGVLDNWFWAENVYGDTSLGCPQPDQVYAQVNTRAYQFTIAYAGNTYDYRVAVDDSAVVLCEVTVTTPTEGETEATAVPAQPATPSAPVVTPAEGELCPLGLEPRLAVGGQGRVTPGLASNLRAAAGTNAELLGQVAAGEAFTVMAGPVCGEDGLAWWQIETADAEGWVAQGQNGLYFVEPLPQALPENLTPLTAANIGQLTQLSQLAGNFANGLAWSPDGSVLAVGNANTVQPSVWLYDANNLEAATVQSIATVAPVTALAFSSDGAFLAIGTANGTVQVWSVADEDFVFSATAHNTAIVDLRFSPAGTALATLGADNTVKFWGIAQ